ncbi:hypothetical protein [Streptomyces uncialis]|uniref:hypothetical protein n=1 Tax=Streptomyces uncialis TaxID=1048205 RepID=UPI00224D9075|nr:hypothetical protein [Streptomyces uncialis]MCX4663486.1 hypothetical protein [Streptomyces uncialis]
MDTDATADDASRLVILRSAAQAAAVILRTAAARIEQGHQVDPDALRDAAQALTALSRQHAGPGKQHEHQDQQRQD